MKPAHYRGTYTQTSKQVRDTANANPNTICWRDGLTLQQHPPHKDGTPPQWQAGHTHDSHTHPTPWLHPTLRPPPGNWLTPEASTCNTTNGAHRTNKHRTNPQPQPPTA